MNYKAKKMIVILIMQIILIIGYLAFVISKYMANMEELTNDYKFWGITIIVTIVIGVALMILVHVGFAIAKNVSFEIKKRCNKETGEDSFVENMDIEDEMDKLISLKSIRNSCYVAEVGFVVGLITLCFGASAFIMINITFLAMNLGSLAEAISQICFYYKGIRNG